MGPHDIEKVAADTERVLAQVNPAFDITEEERGEALRYSENICALVEQYRGDKLEFLETMISMSATVDAFIKQSREIIQGPEHFEHEVDEFDEEHGTSRRINELRQAVNMSCYITVQEEQTVLGKLLELRRRFLHWYRGCNIEPYQPRIICVASSQYNDVHDAIFQALSTGLFASAICNDTEAGILELELDKDIDPDSALQELRDMGFDIQEDSK